jgi:hypothetical protein
MVGHTKTTHQLKAEEFISLAIQLLRLAPSTRRCDRARLEMSNRRPVLPSRLD